MRSFMFLIVFLKLTSCTNKDGFEQVNIQAPEPHLDSTPTSEVAWAEQNEISWLTDTLKLVISGDPAHPFNSRFKNDWRVQVFNIDDHGHRASPVWYGWTDFGGKVDLQLPIEMFNGPMVVKACNEASPVSFSASGCDGTLSSREVFIPAHCNQQRILLDPVSTTMWREFYSPAARFGAQNWSPSQVDCELWTKSYVLFVMTPRVQQTLFAIPEVDDVITRLIPAIRENIFFIYKTRQPLCVAELRHSGGGLKEGRVLRPKELDKDERARESGQGESTPTVGKNGLLRALCAHGEKGNLFRSSLMVNGKSIGPPNIIYDLDSEDFVGNIAAFENSAGLSDLTIKEYTIRHTNGFPREHDDFAQVCSLTSMTLFANEAKEPREIIQGSGLLLENLFDNNGSDAVVWLSSDGDRVVDNQDTWAIIFNGNTIRVPEDLLGICDPNLFCNDATPNFPVALIDDVLLIELLGFRNGDFRDSLAMKFDGENENFFIGLRANYALHEDQSEGAVANFATTVSYLNKTNVTRTLSLCYEAADFLSRQHLGELRSNDALLVVEAAEMVARSQCFSNSHSNQRWRNYRTGLQSINNHKGVRPNLFIPFGWLGPGTKYELYLKKFDGSAYRGPITSVLPGFSGLSLAIPTISEGDELLFVSEDACCNDFKVTVPCTAEPGDLPLPGTPTMLDTTQINQRPRIEGP